MFSGSQHVNHFSENTLEKILKKNKFKIKSTETIISDAGTVINYLNYSDILKKNINKSYKFTDPNFINKQKMGYTLLTIAEKK